MQTAQPVATAEPAPQKVAARSGVSPRGATIALVGVDGPDDTASRFASALAEAATTQDIATAPAASANYLLRGYLTATSTAQGVRLTYVCDLFDRGKQRAQRLTDDIVVPPRGPDPWAAADDLKINALAAHAAQNLADVLTNTPEAIAAAERSAKPAAPLAGTTAVARATPVASPVRAGLADAR